MKQIPLTQGKFAIVDDEDFVQLSKYRWHATNQARKGITSLYARRKSPDTAYMHRFIMKTPKNMICDHINGNTLDNRKSNLRNCTKQQNNFNSNKKSSNKLGLKNIFFHKKLKKYTVSIMVNYKSVYRDYFYTLEEAIEARDKALKKYHGEFANKGK